VVSEEAETIRIRTPSGVFDVEKERIKERINRPSPWQRYRARKRKSPDTPDGLFELAQWCRREGLRDEQLELLERIIELDPDHAGARRALGYVRQDRTWTRSAKTTGRAVADAQRDAERLEKKEQERVRRRIADWHVKIQAIYRGRLDGASPTSDRFDDGRRLILEITDPHAIPALTRVLSQGKSAVRRILVKALSEFDEPEATMDLLLITLVDPSKRARREAALALAQRDDSRIVAELRGALFNEEEFIIRHAAAALGVMGADEAIEDLVAVLSTQTRGPVEVCLPVFLDDVYHTFGACRRRHHHHNGCGYGYGHFPYYYGGIGPTYPMGTICFSQYSTIDVYRTEVQEALIAITGENLGFDRGAWLEWLRVSQQRRGQ